MRLKHVLEGEREISELVRVSGHELLLLMHYRRCTPERKDVLLYFSEQMEKQSEEQKPANVVSLVPAAPKLPEAV